MNRMIAPAGLGSFDWSPKEWDEKKEVVKTASTKKTEAEDYDPLFKAAQDFLSTVHDMEEDEAEEAGDLVAEEVEDVVEQAKSLEEEIEEAECAAECAEEATDEVAEEDLTDDEGAEIADEIETSDLTEEPIVEDGDAVEEECEDEVEEAVQTLENALDELKEMLGVDDIEIVDDEEGLMVESEEEEECEVDDESVTTASSNSFVKIAKLSPENRAKLRKYWKEDLGYPAEYVNLMFP